MAGGLDLDTVRPERVLQKAHIVAAQLDESELEAIVEAMLSITEIGYLITDLEHRSLACNDRFGEFFQVEPAHVPTMEVEELRDRVYPRLADPIAWRHQLDDVYERPDDRHLDQLILVDPFLVLNRTTGPVKDAEGKTIGRIWAFEDATALQNRLRRQEAIYEISTFSKPDPALVCAFVVDRLSEYYGSTALLSICEGERLLFKAAAGVPEWIGDVSENTLPDSYCQFTLRQLKPLIIQDARNEPDVSQVLPARIGFYRYLGAPIIDISGRAIGTICILDGKTSEPLGQEDRDFLTLVAHRLSVELERQRLHAAREQELSSELDTARMNLIEAEKLSVIGTLAATIAHDIRNILSSLALIAHQNELTSDEKLARMETQIDRFNVLSHRLLSYVKPQSVSNDAFDLGILIRETAEMLGPQANISGIVIELDIAEIGPVQGDRHRVEHLLVNLMLNAMQAMRMKGGKLEISLGSGGKRILRIKDDGSGIPIDVRSRIFEPFVSSRKDGFGLGLYSCRQIASEHGWRLSVESEVGEGTVFEIELE